MLSYVPEFVQELKEKNQKDMIGIYEELYKESFSLKDGINISSKVDGILKIDKMTMRSQQDASEYIIKLFDKLNLNANYLNIIQRESILCTHGSTESKSPKDESQILLQVILPNDTETAKLSDLIKEQPPEKLGDLINGCKPERGDALKGPASKKTEILVNPANKYIILHLKRFDNEGKKKINDITIDKSIQLKDTYNTNIDYDLYGIVWHEGSKDLQSGHYMFLRMLENTLIEYDDKTVTEKNIEDLNIGKTAYLIMYKRRAVPAHDPITGASGATIHTEDPVGSSGKMPVPSVRPPSEFTTIQLGPRTYNLPTGKGDIEFRKELFAALAANRTTENYKAVLGHLYADEIAILQDTGFIKESFLVKYADDIPTFFEALPECTTDTAVMLNKQCSKSYFLIYALLHSAAQEAVGSDAGTPMSDVELLQQQALLSSVKPGDSELRKFILNLLRIRTPGYDVRSLLPKPTAPPLSVLGKPPTKQPPAKPPAKSINRQELIKDLFTLYLQ